jgi:hypothetical protein
MTTDVLIPERVERCRKVLAGYSDDDRFVCLIDLLADAMHMCDADAEDFHYALCVAGKHYLAELNDEQTEERRMP